MVASNPFFLLIELFWLFPIIATALPSPDICFDFTSDSLTEPCGGTYLTPHSDALLL